MSHLGHGIGLRREHYQEVLSTSPPQLDWLEAITENFMVPGGNPRRVLRGVRERYPVVLHGVSLSIGSTDPVDEAYLRELKTLAAEVDPAWISDHLCWGSVDGRHAHDLLPLPYTEEALAQVVGRVAEVQERLGRRIALENVSSYVELTSSEMSEAEFFAEVARRADCHMLVDLNNIYVSAHNHGTDAHAYLRKMPKERVIQYHLAGPSEAGALYIDTHDTPVLDEVWSLYEDALTVIGPRPTLVEWDAHIPPLERVLEESRRARAIEAAHAVRARTNRSELSA